ncbi:hypothetical protein KIN20_005412 [Parelaphostrongylus tenuis]|uniref:Uncharacterized protein n=1 Tax=Parelaphostrongylus tenuis TaxID=148309 RepID=A0AAD5M371_PARTN|nr:hypothetical protein KIN20_005412 [Parelaphostrongylus tenuis]
MSTAFTLYPVSEYTLLFPLVNIFFLEKARRARRSNILSMTQMKSTGGEGWAIYSSQLQKQWKQPETDSPAD